MKKRAAALELLLVALVTVARAQIQPGASVKNPQQAGTVASQVLLTQANSLLDFSRSRTPPAVPLKQAAASQRTAAVPSTAALQPPYCGDGSCDAGENCSTCPQDCFQANGKRCGRIGMMYCLWHWPAYNSVRHLRARGFPFYNMEDVLKSRTETVNGVKAGALTMANMILKPGVAELAMQFYWMHTPQGGVYCIYHRRQPGDLNYNAANEGNYLNFKNATDCPSYKAVLKLHAQQLVAAGIDFIVADMTNLPMYDQTSDAIQLRPFEVLVEEWTALRAQGIRTPDIAAWQRMPLPPAKLATSTKSKLAYPYVLNVYNQPEYDQIIMKDSITRKKLFFVPRVDDHDPAFNRDVENNGGRKDVATAYMWVNMQTAPEKGWNFFSFCQQPNMISNAACNQPWTTGPVGGTQTLGLQGSQLAVSPGYQTTYHSVTQQGLGSWEGATFRKQFEQALKVKPDYLFLSTWNEHIAQPQNIKTWPPPFVSQGLETDSTAGNTAFVDVFGSAFGRDIEPTKDGGDLLYRIMASCIKMYRAGATACTSQYGTEACCIGGAFSSQFTYVQTNDGAIGIRATGVGAAANRTALYNCTAPALGRRLLSAAPLQSKLSSGAVVADGDMATGRNTAAPLSEAAAAAAGGRRALLQAAKTWYLSTSSTCERASIGGSYTARQLGFVQTVRGGDFIRAVRRCVNGGGDRTIYRLNVNECPVGYRVEAILGYVR